MKLVELVGDVTRRFMADITEYCPSCAAQGISSTLKTVQLTMRKAVKLCKRDECFYPFQLESFDVIERPLPNHDTNTDNELNSASFSHSENGRNECTYQDGSFSSTEPPSFDKSASTNESDISEITIQSSDSQPLRKYPQWQNERNLCWLDSTCSLLLMTRNLRSYIEDSMNASRIESDENENFNQMSQFLSDFLSKYRDIESMRVSESPKDLLTFVSDMFSSHSNVRISEMMHAIREDFLTFLRTNYNTGTTVLGDNPVFALSALLNSTSPLRKSFETTVSYHSFCKICSTQSCHERRAPIISIQKRPSSDFNISDLGFHLNDNFFCEKCSSQSITKHVHWSRLNRFILIQFCEGLSEEFSVDEWCAKLTFSVMHCNKLIQYKPLSIIEYRTMTSDSMKHFVTWIRAPEHELWMESDDMKGPFCQFDQRLASFPATNTHVVLFMADDGFFINPSYMSPVVLSRDRKSCDLCLEQQLCGKKRKFSCSVDESQKVRISKVLRNFEEPSFANDSTSVYGTDELPASMPGSYLSNPHETGGS